MRLLIHGSLLLRIFFVVLQQPLKAIPNLIRNNNLKRGGNGYQIQ
jgi:hypothetical protein